VELRPALALPVRVAVLPVLPVQPEPRVQVVRPAEPQAPRVQVVAAAPESQCR
jgi:hypothetical protein